jgi:SAM-dependent methyltransferase
LWSAPSLEYAVSSEVEKMRRWLHDQFKIPEGGSVVDLGCGAGDDLRLLARAQPGAARYIGVDRSAKQVAEDKESGLLFVPADLSKVFPFDDCSVDAIYSVNLLECLPDRRLFLDECARILSPGGSILIAHFDWDTQTFDGEDRDLVRRVVHAFNDWKQAWMEAADPWAGRRLWRELSPLFEGEIRTYTLTSTPFEPESYGRQQAESFRALVRRGMVSQAKFDKFFSFLEQDAALGRFFYSVTLYVYVGRKSDPNPQL